jgi:hypothetical protein
MKHATRGIVATIIAATVLLASCGCTITVSDANGGGKKDDNNTAGGDDAPAACFFASADDVQSLRNAIAMDMANGVSRADEIAGITAQCQESVPADAGFTVQDCIDCGTAIVNEVYP